jgi:hypothetical protein
MLLNVLFSDVPMEFTAAMIAIEMPAAIRPYSIAVAPLSSFTKRRTRFGIGSPEFVARPSKKYLAPSFRWVNQINRIVLFVSGSDYDKRSIHLNARPLVRRGN